MDLKKLPSAAILVASLLGTSAQAADATNVATATAPAATDELLDTITVTARRRDEELQDVPLAITVVDGKFLEEAGTFNVARLQQVTPTLQFYSSNPRNSAANIRGLGAPFGLTNDGIEQGVGLYVDDVYYSRAASSTLDFLDVERIEVLRGPQGTLYGKNTTAGAINITTRAPTFEPEGKVEISAGNLAFYQAKAALSGPIIADKLAARIALSTTTRHGTVDNVATHTLINEQDNLGVRGQLLWKAGENLDVTLAGDYNVQNPEGYAQIFARAVETQRPLNRRYAGLITFYPNANTPSGHYEVPSLDGFDRVTDVDAALNARSELGGAALRATWNLGSGSLTSVTAWRYWDWLPENDRDFTGLPVTTASNNPSKQDQYTQEFRYSASQEHFDYVVGVFGYKQKVHTDGLTAYGQAASRWSLGSGFNTVPSILDGLASYNDIDFSNTSAALFGQLSWKISDRFRIEPGVRLNYDKKRGSYDSVVVPGYVVFNGAVVRNAGYRLENGVVVAGAAGDRVELPIESTNPLYSTAGADPQINTTVTSNSNGTSRPSRIGDRYTQQRNTAASQFYVANFKDWNVSGDLKASFEITQDVLAYGSYGRSFKTGGITLNGAPPAADGTADLNGVTARPEKVNSFEVGLKTQFLDRKVTLNVAGFRTDVKDFQLTVTSSNSGGFSIINPRGFLANAEKVRVQGVEADFSIRPNQHFTAYVNGAFTDAKYVSFKNAPTPPELSGASQTTADGTYALAVNAGTAVLNGPGVPTGASTTNFGPAVYDASGTWLPGVSRYAGSWGFEARTAATVLGQEGDVYFGYDGSARSKWSSNPVRSSAREVIWDPTQPNSYYTDNANYNAKYSGRATGLDVAGYGLANFRAGFRASGKWDVYVWVKNAFEKDYWEQLASTPSSTGLVAGSPGDPRTWGVTVRAEF